MANTPLPDPAGRSALVVDDSRPTRMILRQMLVSLGFSVEEAGNGEEALDRLAEHGSYTLAVVDWNMPVMNGAELLEVLQQEGEHPGMKVLMCTTRGEIADVMAVLDLGASDHLTKPFTAEDLTQKITGLGL